MLTINLTDSTQMTAAVQRRRQTIVWSLWLVCLVGLAALTGLFMIAIKPVPVPLGAVVGCAIVASIAYRPRFGLVMALFFALLGDSLLMPWYPFVKNFSSAESLLYINGALIFSPLELILVVTLMAWTMRKLVVRDYTFRAGPLFGPAAAFVFFLITGVLYGIGTGGDANVALWEVRSLIYLPLVLMLVTNLVETQAHVLELIWAAMLALVAEGIIGSHYYFIVLGRDLSGIDRITEHSAAIHMNTFFVFLLAAYLYGALPVRRHFMPVLMLPILVTYLATQRRAAFVSLGVALLLLAFLLFFENRKRFWLIAPAGALLMAGYVAAFWNSGGALGLPARAVKSVIAPASADSVDLASNLYRIIENINTAFTIHQAPLTGVGFGQKFFIIIPMPDISFFVWWEYIVHNSIFWIWMKTGLFGFMALLFLIGFTIATGVPTIWRMPTPLLRAVIATATIYMVMHFLYAYVDMSWDTQSMLYVGAMAGLINRYASETVTIGAPTLASESDHMRYRQELGA